MSGRLIVDASFIASLFLDEEHSAFASERFRKTSDLTPWASDILPWEIANILRTQRRRGLFSAESSDRLFAGFLDMRISLAAKPDPSEYREVARLADRFELSAYDAGYLWLALNGADPLATLDRRLATAGIAAGLSIHAPFA